MIVINSAFASRARCIKGKGIKRGAAAAYLGVLQGSADALAVAQQLAQLGQEHPPQRHQLLNLLPAYMQCILQPTP